MGNQIACCQAESDKPNEANDLIDYSNMTKQEGLNKNVINTQ
jgi:hypothetical protein